MKTYNTNITAGLVNDILTFCSDKGIEYNVLEGCLLDNFLIFANYEFSVKGIKFRKYIIIREKYVTPNSSEYTITFTDDENLANEFLEQVELQEVENSY